jgi:hypothetical protein
MLNPSALHGMIAVCVAQTLNRGDRCIGGSINRIRAGANRLAVHMHCAGPASRDAAPEFCAGQFQLIAQRPEQGHIRLDIKLMPDPVNC